MSFSALPVELTEWICSYCNPKEIRNLRSTCHSIKSVADKYIFQELVLFPTLESLEAARNIVQADSGRWASHPRGLWLQADRLEFFDFEGWRDKVESDFEEEPTRNLIIPISS